MTTARSPALSAEPLWIVAVLAACVAAAEVAARLPLMRQLGAALLVILFTALVANLGVIPTGATGSPVYDAVFDPLAQLAIFLLLLQVDLASLARAGAPMLIAFALGAAGTLAGVAVALTVVGDGLGPLRAELGGMFAATYTGGSLNFNAVAVQYGVQAQDGLLYAGAVAVDSILTTVWMVVTLLVPGWLGAGERARRAPGDVVGDVVAGPSFATPPRASTSLGRQPTPASGRASDEPEDTTSVSVTDLAAALGLAAVALVLSRRAAELLDLPAMLVLTTVALVLAHVPVVRRLHAARTLGMLGVMVFLAVIGAYCDLGALSELADLGPTLFVFGAVLLAVHGLVVFGVGRLARLDPAVCAVASQANVGGGTTALALARSLGRGDLVLPGLLAGSLGTASGTYLGLGLVEWLSP